MSEYPKSLVTGEEFCPLCMPNVALFCPICAQPIQHGQIKHRGLWWHHHALGVLCSRDCFDLAAELFAGMIVQKKSV